MGSPVWLVALVLAAIAPWLVHVYAKVVEERLRRRTVDTIAQASRVTESKTVSPAAVSGDRLPPEG